MRLRNGMRLRNVIAAATAALLAACAGLTAGTHISQSDGVAKHPYRKIAVIAMSASKSERQTFDDALVARLSAAGVDGIVGDRYIEDAAAANGIAPMEAIRAAGADGVIYVWLRRDSDTSRIDPTPGAWGWTGSAAAWYPSAATVQAMMSRFDFRLYDVGTQALVWSGSTTTFYPKSLDADAPPVANAVVAELTKRGFVAGR
jgi:hypothetical protein